MYIHTQSRSYQHKSAEHTDTCIHNIQAITVLHKIEQRNGPISLISISGDSRRIASVASNTIEVWDADTGQLTHTIQLVGWIQFMVLSRDGRRLTCQSGFDQCFHIRVWELDDGTDPKMLRQLDTHTLGASFSNFWSDDRAVICVCTDGAVMIPVEPLS
jgi:WD40 repeat protein